MREFLERFLNGESFKDCLHTNHKDYLLKIKRGEFPLEQARIMADIDLKKIDALKDKYRERPLSKNLKTEVQLAAGEYKMYATARAENFLDSDPSDSIVYVSTYVPEDNEDENQGETSDGHGGGSNDYPPMEGPW
jgi:hypothetical protein